MDEQQKIMAMMVLAEDQQKSAQATLEELAKQVCNLQRSAADAIRDEVNDTIGIAFKNHGSAIDKAVRDSQSVVEAIKASTKGVSWKLAAVAFLAALSAFAAFAISTYGLVGWQSYQLRSIASEKANLTQEVAVLKSAAADFAKRAGKAQLSTCGDNRRLCIKVDKTAGGFGNDREVYAIIKGY